MTLPKVVKKVQVKNFSGLHVRPASAIVELLQKSKSTVTFTHNKETINAKSILSILMMAITRNSTITVKIEGEDAIETMEQLITAFENKFGE